jgi:hypothetical protein
MPCISRLNYLTLELALPPRSYLRRGISTERTRREDDDPEP